MPKTWVSNFTVRLGPFAVAGKLVSVKRSGVGQSEFKLMTPNGKPVKQFYMAEGDDHPYTRGELGSGRLVDGKLVPVSQEEIDEARDSDLPDNIISVSVHPVEQVAKHLWHSDNAYIFIPHQADEYFGSLRALLASSEDHAFMGICNLHSNEGLYRLIVWNGSIVVEKMLYPEDLNCLDAVETEIDPKLMELMPALMEAWSSDFEPEQYRNTIKERLAAIPPLGEGEEVTPEKKGDAKRKQNASNLLADLQALVAAKPAAAKKVPAKKSA